MNQRQFSSFFTRYMPKLLTCTVESLFWYFLVFIKREFFLWVSQTASLLQEIPNQICMKPLYHNLWPHMSTLSRLNNWRLHCYVGGDLQICTEHANDDNCLSCNDVCTGRHAWETSLTSWRSWLRREQTSTSRMRTVSLLFMLQPGGQPNQIF